MASEKAEESEGGFIFLTLHCKVCYTSGKIEPRMFSVTSLKLYPIIPFLSSSFPAPFLPSSSLHRPRSCNHFFGFIPACQVSCTLAHLSPNTCVSGGFQEKGPGCQRKQAVTRSFLLGSYLTQACLSASPLEDPALPPETVFLGI